jgi:hypothetical protein
MCCLGFCLQVEPHGTFVATGELDKDTKGNRWKASLYTTRAPLYLQKWIAADPQLSRSLADYTSRPPAAVSNARAGAGAAGAAGGGDNARANGVGPSSHTASGMLLKLVGIVCVMGLLL